MDGQERRQEGQEVTQETAGGTGKEKQAEEDMEVGHREGQGTRTTGRGLKDTLDQCKQHSMNG